MAKKDFTASTDNVLDDFFSQPTEPIKKEVQKVTAKKTQITNIKKEVKTPIKEKVEKKEIEEKQEKANSIPANKKEEEKAISTPAIKTEETKTTPKTSNKDCRYNFYLDNELIDFVENCLWLKRQKNYAQYFNSLIRQDLLKTLGLPADTSTEKMLEKWEEYKKNNNI